MEILSAFGDYIVNYFANVPAQWQAFPAFRLTAAAGLTITERSRALTNPDDNQLHLTRQVWLDAFASIASRFDSFP